MKKWWAPIPIAIVAVAIGLPAFAGLSSAGKMPLWLRDHPWPLEIVCALLTLLLAGMLAGAFREKKRRAVTTLSTLVAAASTAFFIYLANVALHQLPPPPAKGLGAVAADFTLPDETGKPVSLASLRGKPLVVLFYRGFW
jgi:ribose/xylose/arabinose/galactoside ABC-type transport system permease subunit